MGINIKVMVVLERIELSSAEVIAKAYRIPKGVFGKKLRSFEEK
jgi:hypothetical protein